MHAATGCCVVHASACTPALAVGALVPGCSRARFPFCLFFLLSRAVAAPQTMTMSAQLFQTCGCTNTGTGAAAGVEKPGRDHRRGDTTRRDSRGKEHKQGRGGNGRDFGGRREGARKADSVSAQGDGCAVLHGCRRTVCSQSQRHESEYLPGLLGTLTLSVIEYAAEP